MTVFLFKNINRVLLESYDSKIFLKYYEYYSLMRSNTGTQRISTTEIIDKCCLRETTCGSRYARKLCETAGHGMSVKRSMSSTVVSAKEIIDQCCTWCSSVVFEREAREFLFILSLSHTDRNSCSKCTIEMHARMHTRLDDENSNTNARTQVPPQLDSRTRAVRSMLQDLLSHSSFQVLLQAEQ